MGRFVPALISLDGDDKYVVYDTAEGMQKVSRVVSSGGGGGNLVLHVALNQAETAYVLDKTWNEIRLAFEGGAMPVIEAKRGTVSSYEGFFYLLRAMGSSPADGGEGTDYGVSFIRLGEGSDVMFVTDSADGYPESLIGE